MSLGPTPWPFNPLCLAQICSGYYCFRVSLSPYAMHNAGLCVPVHDENLEEELIKFKRSCYTDVISGLYQGNAGIVLILSRLQKGTNR
jgi:hypothetical protein